MINLKSKDCFVMKKIALILIGLGITNLATALEKNFIGAFSPINGGSSMTEYLVPVSIELINYDKVKIGYTTVTIGLIQDITQVSLADDKDPHNITVSYLMLNCKNKTFTHEVQDRIESTMDMKVFYAADAYNWDGSTNKHYSDYDDENESYKLRAYIFPQDIFESACNYFKDI